MAKSQTDSPARPRERSARYPGVSLAEAITFARQLADKGVDGLPANAIAAAMGYKNIRTHTFSAAISAARQFGLLRLHDGAYSLTELAREVLGSVDSHTQQNAVRRAFLTPALYSELSERFGDRRVPDAPALANWLHHNHQITTSAKQAAAEVFIASARDARALGDDGMLRTSLSSDIVAKTAAPREPQPTAIARSNPDRNPHAHDDASDVTFSLRLWGPDEGATIEVRGPASMSKESFERLLQALRLHVRISDE